MEMETQRVASSVLKPVEQMFGIEGKVIAVLVQNPNAEFTQKDLMELAKISQTFLRKYYRTLKETGAIKVTKKVGKVEFFMPNLENGLIRIMEKWYVERLKEMELEDAKREYNKHYKGKETDEDKTLVELLILYEEKGSIDDNKIGKKIADTLEKQGMIISKNEKTYFTDRGYEIAKSLLWFNREVVQAVS